MGDAARVIVRNEGAGDIGRDRRTSAPELAALVGRLAIILALILVTGCSASTAPTAQPATTTPVSLVASATPVATTAASGAQSTVTVPAIAATATPVAAPTATPSLAATPTEVGMPTPSATPSPTGVPPSAPTTTVPTSKVTVTVPTGLATGALAQPRSLTLPAGFQVSVFAAGLDSPRWLAFSPEGVLFASIPSQGRVVALPDRNSDGVADEVVTFADSLNQPHGLAFFSGALYVAENQRVVRFSYDPKAAQPKANGIQIIVPNLPTDGQHWTRTITFGPDGKLYVSAGSDCNSCVEEDSRRAAITQYNADGSGERVYASGLRNSVGLTWRPGTSDLWATDNGRDYLGDDLPPDEVNVIKDGADYGWPYCYGSRVPDPQLGSASRCATTQPPTVALQAHSAPLGLAFYSGAQFPAEYRGDLFVAFHGSWNRTVPTGYKLVRVRMANGKPTGQVQDFATGWLDAGTAWGRPVDPIVGPDGSIYLTDDVAGVVYRISYKGGVPT